MKERKTAKLEERKNIVVSKTIFYKQLFFLVCAIVFASFLLGRKNAFSVEITYTLQLHVSTYLKSKMYLNNCRTQCGERFQNEMFLVTVSNSVVFNRPLNNSMYVQIKLISFFIISILKIFFMAIISIHQLFHFQAMLLKVIFCHTLHEAVY